MAQARKVAMLGLIGVLATFAWMVAPAGSQVGSDDIAGTATRGGEPIDEVLVDLFAGTADGERVRWLGSTTTGTDGPGTYRFDTAAFDHDGPCWVVTFVADGLERFENRSRWLNRTVCPEPGQAADGIDAVQIDRSAVGTYTGGVRDVAVPLADVQIDLFTAQADGTRGAWVYATTTDADGDFRLVADPGCYVITYIAPAGRGWVESQSRWLNVPWCATTGFRSTPAKVVIGSSIGPGVLLGQVLDDGLGVADVTADLFDGQRRYVWSQTTDANGWVRFELEQTCYKVTFIAPTGRTFEDSGTGYTDRYPCTRFGQETTMVPAVLTPVEE
ncbi:MAG: hypothetical protein AAGA93_07090 [Actinomycetota bacterium]